MFVAALGIVKHYNIFANVANAKKKKKKEIDLAKEFVLSLQKPGNINTFDLDEENNDPGYIYNEMVSVAYNHLLDSFIPKEILSELYKINPNTQKFPSLENYLKQVGIINNYFYISFSNLFIIILLLFNYYILLIIIE